MTVDEVSSFFSRSLHQLGAHNGLPIHFPFWHVCPVSSQLFVVICWSFDWQNEFAVPGFWHV